MSKKIIGIDIGGTTFSSSLFDEDLNVIKTSPKELISNVSSTRDLLNYLSNQVNNFNCNELIGIGVACPGPLDSKNGIILDTPNLVHMQNINLRNELETRTRLPVYIENDANLFALGEWKKQKNSPSVFGALTLGTGLGFGIIINEKIFSGANGMAAEYAISPLEHGNWETYISISGIEKMALNNIKKKLTPKELYDLASTGNNDAQNIWDEFGVHLGLAMSHFINMIDPQMISLGGGVSKAFKYFSNSMKSTIKDHCPSYAKNQIDIFESKDKELSAQIGAASLLQTKLKS
tara:strand:- start:2063 stop:2938 length:876 start_codon:yes stop_codon:yes gene_type:complete